MELPNPKDLSKFIDLLRKKGIKSFKSGEFEIHLDPYVPESAYKQKKNEGEFVEEKIYDEEAALFWSSAGLPDLKESHA